jgi:hypothetical protein
MTGTLMTTTNGPEEGPPTMSDKEPQRPPASHAPAEPEGGDAACWMHRVCAACGALQDTAPFDRCERCGAAAEDP